VLLLHLSKFFSYLFARRDKERERKDKQQLMHLQKRILANPLAEHAPTPLLRGALLFVNEELRQKKQKVLAIAQDTLLCRLRLMH